MNPTILIDMRIIFYSLELSEEKEEDSILKQDFAGVQRERFDLVKPNVYILQGSWPKNAKPEVFLDKQLVKVSVSAWDSPNAANRFEHLDSVKNESVTMRVEFPDDLKIYKKFFIYGYKNGKKFLWFSCPISKLLRKQNIPQYYIEEVHREFGMHYCSIRGWAVHKDCVQIQVVDKNHREIPFEIQYTSRPDVVQMYEEYQIEPKCGFYIEVNDIQEEEIYLVFSAGNTHTEHKIALKKEEVLLENAMVYWEKGCRYLKLHGPLELTKKAVGKLKRQKQDTIDYSKWLKKHMPTKKELEQQRGTRFEWKPKFSIVVPLYKTPEEYLRAMVDSVKQQTYANWQLCLSDGSGVDSPLKEVLEELQTREPRIKVVSHQEPLKISENTNAAIQEADGDFIVFADHDDVLTPNALFECVEALNNHSKTKIIYSDEDKMSMDGKEYFQPHFKPDFNIDLLCTVNYICHLFVVQRDIIEQVGVLRSEYDGSQDYDFVFRCVEAVTEEQIYHVPKILYHWRCHKNSTSENPQSKLYAFDAGQRAIQDHYKRIGVNAEVYKGEYLGLYRTRFIRDYDPLISILIPNKDHSKDLKRFIESIENKSTYKNYEYIVIENNSVEEATFAYYKELEKENPKVRVVYWDGIFNYSAINNFGAQYAKGEYLLLLNNDTEIINPDCLEELLGYCMREDVGIVGARLYYEDDTIQHAGVVVGFGGIAGNCFVHQPRSANGYFSRIISAQDYSAVTAACLMVKKHIFDQVGGLTEELVVAFNDVDFCLKVRQAGYLVVYNPYAELYHYESKSRGLEDTPEKVARFNREIEIFAKRWPDILRDGDPFYNPNLTLENQDFSLKRL